MREVGWGLRDRACPEGIGPGGIMHHMLKNHVYPGCVRDMGSDSLDLYIISPKTHPKQI